MLTAKRGSKIFIGTLQYSGTLLGSLKYRTEAAKLVVVSYDETRSGIPAGRAFAVPVSKVLLQEARYQPDTRGGYKYRSFLFDWDDLEKLKFIPTGAGMVPDGTAHSGVKDNRKRKVKEPRDHEDT